MGLSLIDRILLFEGVQGGVAYSSAIQAEYVRVAMLAGQTREQALAPFTDAVGYSRYGETNMINNTQSVANHAALGNGTLSYADGVFSLNRGTQTTGDHGYLRTYETNTFASQQMSAYVEVRAKNPSDIGKSLIMKLKRVGASGGTYIEDSEAVTLTEAWQPLSFALTAQPNNNQFAITFNGDITGGLTLYDDVELRYPLIQQKASSSLSEFKEVGDRQVIPNIFNAGTNDATRGANAGVASDDPAIISEGFSFDGVDDRFGGIPSKDATHTEIYVDDADVHVIDSAGGQFTNNVASAITSPDLSTGGGYTGDLKEYYILQGLVLTSAQRGYFQTAFSNLGII